MSLLHSPQYAPLQDVCGLRRRSQLIFHLVIFFANLDHNPTNAETQSAPIFRLWQNGSCRVDRGEASTHLFSASGKQASCLASYLASKQVIKQAGKSSGKLSVKLSGKLSGKQASCLVSYLANYLASRQVT